MRWIMLIGLMVAVGCDSSKDSRKSTELGSSTVSSGDKKAAELDSSPPKSGGQELDVYVEKLKADTPVDIKQFQDAKMKAVEYEKNERYPDLFRFVVIEVPRVYLSDKTTGKGQWCTRARLTLNNPAPVRLNSRGSPTSIPEPFAWAKVEMMK